MKIIAYHTPGPYAEEARRLIRSLKILRLGPHLIIEEIEEMDWLDATAYKPVFIRKMLKKNKCPVLFIDSDAVVHHNPCKYFKGLKKQGYHVAMHRRNLWQTGTVWMNNSKISISLLDEWIALNEQKRKAGDRDGGGQTNLNIVLRSKKTDKWLKNIPVNYCWFDLMQRTHELSINAIIIEHLQASRDYKESRTTPETLLQLRHKRIKEIETRLGL